MSEPEKKKRGRKVIPGRRAHPNDPQAPDRARLVEVYAKRIANGERRLFGRDDERRGA